MNEFDELLNHLVSQKQKKNGPVLAKQASSENKNEVLNNPKDYISDRPKKTLSSSSKIFSPVELKEKLRAQLIDEYYTKQKYEKPYSSVTEILGCLRRNYYYRAQYNPNMDALYSYPLVKFFGEIGTAIHNVIEGAYGFDETEKSIFSEVYKVKGVVDAIKKNYVIDFKTIKERNFKGHRIHDYQQVNIYAHILKTEYKYNIEHVTLIYFFSDNLDKTPYAIDLELREEDAISYLIRSKMLLEALENRVVPDMIGATEDSCKYCEFVNVCKNEGKVKKPDPKDAKYDIKEIVKQHKSMKSKGSFSI